MEVNVDVSLVLLHSNRLNNTLEIMGKHEEMQIYDIQTIVGDVGKYTFVFLHEKINTTLASLCSV